MVVVYCLAASYLYFPLKLKKLVFNFFMYYVVFPDSCRYFHGSHSYVCLLGMWQESGCTSEGEYSPKMDSHDLNLKYDSMNLK